MPLNRSRSTSRFVKISSSVVATALLAALFMFVTPVDAQTVSIIDPQAPLLATSAAKVVSSPTLSPTVSPQPSATPVNTALAKLREKYKTDLSIYRTDERDFALAKEQFLKLQTLASLEVSVKATRKVMITRAAVLQDYAQILRLIIQDSSGIDVAEKTALLKQLDTMNDRLKSQQQLAEQAIDRESVQKAVVDFAQLSTPMTALSYKSMSYISYARLQTVYDKMLAVRDEVTTQLTTQENNGLKLGEKRRALDEINRNLEQTKLSLSAVHKTFIPNSSGLEPQFDAGSYPQTVQALSSIYADLYRNLSFLREVIK